MWQGIQSDPSSNDSDEYMSASSNDSDEYMSASSNPMSQESQSDPSSNDSDEYMSASSNHVYRPLPDLLYVRTENGITTFRPEYVDTYLEIAVPLYKASIKCDWKAAEAILNKNANIQLVKCSVIQNGDTALHIAASAKGPKKVDAFVRNLVGRIKKKDLELVNNNESTALYLAAAAGNIETVKIMMGKHKTLDTIPGGGGDIMPLYAAVLFGHKDVARYLYERSKDLGKVGSWNRGWNPKNRKRLLKKCVESDMFDIATQIVREHPGLGWSLFSRLARKPEAFDEKKPSNTESNIIRRTIKSVSAFICCKAGTPVEKNEALTLLRLLWEETMASNVLNYKLKGRSDLIKLGSGKMVQTIQLKQLIFNHLDELIEETQALERGTLEVPKVLHDLVSKHVVNMHVETQKLIKQENTTDEDQALDLQKLISEYIVKFHRVTRNFVNDAKRITDEDGTRWDEHGNSLAFYAINSPLREVDELAEKYLARIIKYISKMRAKTETLSQYVDTFSHPSRVMFIAAEVCNTNFLLEFFRIQPDLIWEVDDNGLSIFHIAVKHRHEVIYNLLYEIGSMKDMVTPLRDNDGNNMLHLAAMRTSKKNLEDVSGAALQMQRELLWFKEVERMIPPYLRESKNKDGFTPRELFTIEHQDLIEKGEKWMKHTASQCMVVATLVATIVFAAAFTVPGGYHENEGTPIFKWKVSFVTFVVADAISLFLSSASILTVLSILTSRYAERDFVAALPMKLMLGLVTLFLSIGTMMVTFSVSFFVLYHKEMKWIPIFISGFAVIPAILYVVLQFHLLVDVVRSTYGGKYLLNVMLKLFHPC